MTNYVHGTIIVTTAVANNLKNLAKRLDKNHCDGMFIVGLSATGAAPASHFISSGHIPAGVVHILKDQTRLFNAAKAAWEADGDVFPFTQAQITNALSKCTLHDGTYTSTIDGITAARPESPHQLMARLGLQFVRVAI